MNSTRIICALIIGLSSFALNGCDDSPRKAPSFDEDNYSNKFAITSQWSVEFGGKVSVEVGQDGTINVYGIAEYANGSTYWPDIKVSGPAKFTVHSGDRVTVTNGAIVAAYECAVVRARAGTTIDAHNCDLVETYGAVKSVQLHGRTRLEKHPEPDSPLGPSNKSAPAVPSTTSFGSTTSNSQRKASAIQNHVAPNASNQTSHKTLPPPTNSTVVPTAAPAKYSPVTHLPLLPNPTSYAMK